MERIYIKELSGLIDRKPATIRAWERDDALPDHLRSSRDERGWRYWTDEKVTQIREWLVDTDRRPGKGLPFYQPDPERIQLHIHRQRKNGV